MGGKFFLLCPLLYPVKHHSPWGEVGPNPVAQNMVLSSEFRDPKVEWSLLDGDVIDALLMLATILLLFLI